ncbi:MAG: glycosyltransferase [Pseudomonadota bacterium]|nr:glycosyltransferase [Pseudomonadota bacterium]
MGAGRAMGAKPRVSVVIPHYRDLGALDLCLAALGRQTWPAEDFEIVVADNASPEGEGAVTRAVAGRGRLIVVPERGAGPARNGGVAVARGAILAFIDADCQAEPAWLAEGVKALSAHDFIGGRVKVLVADPNRMTPTEAFERVFAFDFKTYIARRGFTGTGNLFCRRALFDAVGGFRVGVSEDVEWSRRARAAGYRLGYAPTAVVGHPARRTWRELLDKWRRVNRETFALYASRERGRARWLLRSLVLPISAVVHAPRVLFSPELDRPSQRLAALGVLFRLRFWRLADALRRLAGADI